MLGEGFKHLLMKKKQQGKVLSPEVAGKKMEVIQELMDAMGEDMGEKVKGLKKVTVAAKDDEGLMKGLEKAEEVLEQEKPEDDNSEEESSEEEGESEDMSKEAIKAKIAELQAKLA